MKWQLDNNTHMVIYICGNGCSDSVNIKIHPYFLNWANISDKHNYEYIIKYKLFVIYKIYVRYTRIYILNIYICGTSYLVTCLAFHVVILML